MRNARIGSNKRATIAKKVHIRCSACRHRDTSIFCDLAGTHLNTIDEQRDVHTFDRGQTIFYEGNPAFAIYCVFSGLVKLFKTSKRGERRIIRLLGPGEIMGYRALVANEQYAATAEAVEATTVCIISKDTILLLLREAPAVALRLLAKMAHELRTSEEQMLDVAYTSVRQRIAQTLLFLMRKTRAGGKDVASLEVPLLRKEIADMIGTTPETLSRTLRQFSQAGILKVTRSNICVQKLSRLQSLASESIGPT
ncbi:MAG TPA: hypothetical protein DGH68_00175 [Bacteroidetes bacterium]|jgi:CRP/FNR family transcriptional regulator, polysaccharide utilization system transcription regulator|nr:hypothetical protein [Bacteroidota bacterium]